MANEIKLKRGSGSDPGTSDLSVGEIAIRTDNGKLFTKRDNGSVTEITGGGGIDDGDKGDITVSNSGATFTIDNNAVTAAKINGSAVTNTKLFGDISADKLEVNNAHIIVGDSNNDGTLAAISGDATLANNGALTIANSAINNAKVASDAAIAGSKISPDFGSQNVATTGTLASGNLTITSTQPFLSLQDSNNENDFEVGNAGGLFRIRDVDAAANRLTISSAGVTTIAGNLDVGAGVDVTGDITVSGTVDGRDLATDGSKLDGIESGATADQTKSDIDGLGIAASTAATLATARTIAGVSFDGSANISLNNNAITNGAGYITATLTNEQVQDIVGGMVTGNTETGITVTYQDSDGTLDFVIGTLNQDTTGNAASADTIDVTNTATDSSFPLTFVNTNGSARTLRCDTSGLVFNPYSNTLTTNNFNGGGASLTDLNASNITSGTLASARIADDAITNAKIDAGAVNSASLGTDAVATAKIQDDAVTNAKIANNAVDTAQLAAGSVQHSKLDGDAVDGDNIADDSINSEHYVDGSIDTAHIADDAVTGAKIGHGTVAEINLQTNAVTTAKINNGAVTNAKIDSMAASKLTGALPAIDGSSLTGISAGATGGGSDEIFYENGQNVTTNYTITNGKNAMAAGPITINSGVTVTVGSGETLTIV